MLRNIDLGAARFYQNLGLLRLPISPAAPGRPGHPTGLARGAALNAGVAQARPPDRCQDGLPTATHGWRHVTAR